MSGEISDRDLELADLANAAGASDFAPGASAPQMARQQRLAYEQARQALEAIRPAVKTTIVYHDGVERRAAAETPRLYQPCDRGVIVDRDGQPYWGPFHCCSVYVATGAEHAQRVRIARDHAQALRENDYYDRRRLTFAVTSSGRAALAAETRRAS